jgi:hypothetical protein
MCSRQRASYVSRVRMLCYTKDGKREKMVLQGKDWMGASIRVSRSAFLVVGMIAAVGVASAQNTIPDAQVEANVLKALAGSSSLANQAITTRTVYGTVTLSGSVQTDAQRGQAETLAANAAGVQKVIDELTLGTTGSADHAPGSQATDESAAAPGMVLQSDGSYAPAPATAAQGEASAQPAPGSAPASMAQRNDPENDQALDQQLDQQQGSAAPGSGNSQTANGGNPQGQYPSGQGPMTQPYPQTQPYPSAQPYPAYPDYQRRPLTANNSQGYGQPGYPQQGYQGGGYAPPPYGGQVAGKAIVIPSGTMVRVRLNQGVSSRYSKPGSTFNGIVVNDVTAGGAVAIPRGASVSGTVVDAQRSGVLKGRGELSLVLTSVSMGGKTFPLQTLAWSEHGGDKTTETVDKTAGFGALGAVFGALAGGGVGAAVGGGIGAAAGLGSSAASGHGQVFIPAEGLVAFSLSQATPVTTVSEQEMQRLAYGAAPQGQPAYYPGRRGYYGGAYPGYPSGYPYGYPQQ